MIPSIFNDVIGPVMRGPSSSHSAAAVRIGLIARALMNGEISRVTAGFDRSGSLATTHTSQGSDMGLSGGLLGFGVADERLPDYANQLRRAGIEIEYVIDDYQDPHPNTYRLSLRNAQERHTLRAVSTGGGMLEVIDIDGCQVSLQGDRHLLLVYFAGGGGRLAKAVQALRPDAQLTVQTGKARSYILLKSHTPLDRSLAVSLTRHESVLCVRIIPPVLPVATPVSVNIPFANCRQMLAFNRDKQMDLGELALAYESARGAISRQEVRDKMTGIIQTIRKSIRTGLRGTDYRDRILGCQSVSFRNHLASGRLMDLGALNTAILYVTALMEVKSALGVIVAAPTAGSCGGLPGTLLGAADAMNLDDTKVVNAFLAAGLVGIFIAGSATFAAEVGGCQAECGSGSGMAAAGLVELLGGTPEQALTAAAMALQNSFGMTCDPVANRVEAPCLGKNLMSAGNAFATANVALAGYDAVIPLDETISAMDAVGKNLPATLRCTGLGGLSITPTSRKIEQQLRDRLCQDRKIQDI